MYKFYVESECGFIGKIEGKNKAVVLQSLPRSLKVTVIRLWSKEDDVFLKV